jgi:hypothetical protein
MGTAILLSGMQFFPLLMLIHTPAGYQALTAETLPRHPASDPPGAEGIPDLATETVP